MKIFGMILFLWAGVYAQPIHKYVHTRPLMGTEFKIILYTSDSLQALQAANAAFDRVDELNQIMSDYQADSEVSHLSASSGSGQKVVVSPELWLILKQAHWFSKKSKGAFDVSIGPLSKLWRRAFRQHAFPSQEKIDGAKLKVNYRFIKFFPSSQSVKLTVENMRLDLGGIAKGYAADEAISVIQDSFGIQSVLVDAGGDIVMGEAPPKKAGWEIILEEPSSTAGPRIMILHSCAIATSGDTYRYLEHNERRYSHLINPKTGLGMTDHRHVTVIAQSGLQADAWASCLSILSIDRIAQRWIKHPKGFQYALIFQTESKQTNLFKFGTIPPIP